MDSSPNLTLPYIIAAQAQKHVTHNEAIRALDALVHLMVLDLDLATPPGSPTDGDRYVVAASPDGAWTGHAGEVAAWQDGAWAFFAPREGWLAWVADEGKLYVHDGLAWAEVTVGAGSGAAIWGINATADTTNRLAVKSPASLFDNDGDDHRQIINKNAAGDTAATLYQTGYSGRAEFGLAGDDDFHVKVSPDGSAWNEAIVVDRTTGAARFPSTAYLDLPADSAPATPASGKVRLYAKTDKSLYQKDDAGTETGLAGGGGGGGSSTLVTPQGRLTLTSGSPVLSANVAAATAVYYTPYVGSVAPFWDGSAWTLASLPELSLALDGDSGHTGYHQSGKNFDLFLNYNAGSPRLVSGPAWTNDTTPAAALTRQNGIVVNNASIVVRFGTGSGDTATIGANLLTHVGTFRASANGQTQHIFGGISAGGTAAQHFLWNRYNRVPVVGMVGDSTNTWTYATAAWREANASTTFEVRYVCGAAEDPIEVTYAGLYNSGGAGAHTGVGIDSTTAFAGSMAASNVALNLTISAIYKGLPGLGYHVAAGLEYASAPTITGIGDANSPTAFQSGLHYALRM